MSGVPETSSGESHATAQSRAWALAHLGERALREVDLHALTSEAVAVLARTLDADYSEFQELLADGQTLVLLAGTGWRDGYVGQATVPVTADFQEGYTLGQQKAVRVDDLQSERRFRPSNLQVDHAIVSGVTVAVRGAERL
jgi:GAF domain-containing protein